MSVSVIIPTFNRLSLLKRAIASVESQSFKEYELIIVDDASTDGTGAYLKDSPHRVITNRTNRGVSASRNAGIKASSKALIAFLDSDDTWDGEKLSRQVAFHQANAAVRCSFGSERWIRNGSEVRVPAKYGAPLKAEFHQLLEFTYIGPSGVMVEKSLLDEAGLFDEALPACEDFDLWLRVAKLTSLYRAPEVTVTKYAGHEDQLSDLPALDRYRVEALMKHLHDRRDEVLPVIEKKLSLLEKGGVKHHNVELLGFCQRIRERLS